MDASALPAGPGAVFLLSPMVDSCLTVDAPMKDSLMVVGVVMEEFLPRLRDEIPLPRTKSNPRPGILKELQRILNRRHKAVRQKPHGRNHPCPAVSVGTMNENRASVLRRKSAGEFNQFFRSAGSGVEDRMTDVSCSRADRSRVDQFACQIAHALQFRGKFT